MNSLTFRPILIKVGRKRAALDERKIEWERGVTNVNKKINRLACAPERRSRMPFEISAAEQNVTLEGAGEAFRALRASAQRNGVQNLALDEIDEEIRQARRGEEPGVGKGHRIDG